jgi:cellulose synthase/poly-beta-1,6-N-acetylglucosamine synthase-like glycosyltransferase
MLQLSARGHARVRPDEVARVGFDATDVDAELDALRDELVGALARIDQLRRTIATQSANARAERPTEERLIASEPTLVPVLNFRDDLKLRGLVFAGAAATCWFWMWWLGQGHGAWTVPSLVVTGLFAWLTLLSAYFFFFVTRMTKPNPALPVPDLRVAMVVTKAPTEPWSVVRRTLEAMLDQDYPHPYDVWLADERPDDETLRWCDANEVWVSTRFGVEEYHRAEWPRRTKCKEGNLAFFYDAVGYDNYDVVAQLDADHVPARDYLANMVRPFTDPKIGYVCAPSVCDANEDIGWTVKGRLYKEATLHGPVQAGSNAGFAPVCIGSHYAVRTKALREVGGLGPELAEDYTTTLWLQSGGWDGVFSIDAEAHGDGPESVAEMLTQEIQWARSLGTVLTRYAPTKLKTIPWRARLRLWFALMFYPLQGIALLAAAALPTLGVFFGVSWGNTSLIGFYGHLWPLSIAGLATAAFLRRRGILRPADAKLWSWELVIFQLLRWPWAMVGAFQGMWLGFRRRERAFKVTPKGVAGFKPLPASYVLPSILLGAIPAWVAVSTANWGRAPGLALLVCGQALGYLIAICVAGAIHVSRNARAVAQATDSPLQWEGLAGVVTDRSVVVSFAIVVPTLAAMAFRLSQIM